MMKSDDFLHIDPDTLRAMTPADIINAAKRDAA